eukprot:CAMPEP_0113612244 /NCGR_PEP_ID=MMETSP0017_2-20120614/5998_1 /TAXON_ID=2856 /ORGANISM="Cylindrotheca closterium" /LENGTH=402 /DNA_ID=CAMNT_0000521269 /DNA_START=2800 /DNA_END=4005 /DNA_ORIENTATION=- /assembly_acc=CAM_ASM_000147
MNSFLCLILFFSYQVALAFQTHASGFRFVVCKKETTMNDVFSRQVPTVRLSFEGGESPSILVVDENAVERLTQAINSNSTAADALLSEISMMREKAVSQETMESYLNNLLVAGPDKRLPFWARSKRMARFSRRARMASLRRTLDLTTPTPEAEEETEERKLGRRRRALVALLRSISTEKDLDSKEPAIVTLEKRARLASKESDADMKSRMPEGLETPDYDIVATSKHNGQTIEIRRYKPFSVCAVNMNKPRPEAATETDNKVRVPEISGASSFGALAGYLFGKNDQSTAMKMTTPVFTSPIEDGDKQMEFVLPSNYWDDDSLGAAPKPLSGSGVSLQQRESQDRAVLMFGGYASKKEVAKRKKELMAALKKDKEWKVDGEEATTAQYNDPFTVPWRRLNEVS